MRLEVSLGEAASCRQPVMAGKPSSPLEIGTARAFGFDEDARRWVELHHHVSIDDPSVLRAYQQAVNG